MSQSFVLSGLQSFLNVGQNRLEIRSGVGTLREKRPVPSQKTLGAGEIVSQPQILSLSG
jgi:hypothetical protein